MNDMSSIISFLLHNLQQLNYDEYLIYTCILV